MRAIEPITRTARQQTMIADAVDLASDTDEGSPLIGYVTLAFYGDGTTRTAAHRPDAEEHRIGSTMFEAWARRTLEDHFGYVEGVRATFDVLNGHHDA